MKPLSRPRQALNIAAATICGIVIVLVCATSADARGLPVGLVICDVFGKRHCADALQVAWCESRFNVNARNGQYLGLFQMGRWERRNFGHGSGAYAQARAAYRYFVRTGRDWSPWECKPTRGA